MTRFYFPNLANIHLEFQNSKIFNAKQMVFFGQLFCLINHMNAGLYLIDTIMYTLKEIMNMSQNYMYCMYTNCNVFIQELQQKLLQPTLYMQCIYINYDIIIQEPLQLAWYMYCMYTNYHIIIYMILLSRSHCSWHGTCSVCTQTIILLST